MTKTPNQKWAEAIAQHKERCRKIMGISNSIRYAGVVNEFGRTLTGTLRPGIRPILDSEQAKNEFFMVSTLASLRAGPVRALGAFDHATIRHKRASIVVFRRKNLTYYISVSPKERDLDGLIGRIRKVL